MHRALAHGFDPGGAFPAERVRAVVLLAGALRPTRFLTAIRRSVFDLPLGPDRRLLDHWRAEVASLADRLGGAALPLRLMIDGRSPAPDVGPAAAADPAAPVAVERDSSDFRGTGGLLHDISRDYGDDDFLVVASGAQLLLEPLPSLVRAAATGGPSLGFVSPADGTPVGLTLVRCGALRRIPRHGFIDFKEQAVPSIADRHDVRAVVRASPVGVPVRDLAGYLQALRHWRGSPEIEDAFAEQWSPTFAVVEPGAEVGPGVRVHDSVVLAGARVESEAVLVRSLVCAGATVGRRNGVVEEVVTAEPARASRWWGRRRHAERV